MNRNEIAEKVKKIAGDLYGLQPDCIEETDSFDNLGDSLDAIEMSQRLEDQFNFRFAEDDRPKFETIGDAINLVQKHL